MKIVRKQTTQSQSKRMVEAYSEIFRNFYYRHEFARRNKEVTDVSTKLAKSLGIDASRFEVFVLDGRPLTDELIDVVASPKSSQRREKLGDYLGKFNVLPVTPNKNGKTPYLSKELYEPSERHLLDWKLLFQSLMQFESTAMAELGLGHPVIFPVMPLSVKRKGESQFTKLESLKLNDYPSPTFIDSSVPEKTLRYYSDALDFEVEDHRRKHPSKDERLGQATFDEYLDILDHHASLTRGDKGNAKIEYYKSFMPEGKKVDTATDRDAALRWYDKKHLQALYYRDNYVELV